MSEARTLPEVITEANAIFPRLKALLSGDLVAKTELTTALEQLGKAKADLASASTELSTTKTALEAARADLATAQQKASSLETEAKAKDEKIASLEKEKTTVGQKAAQIAASAGHVGALDLKGDSSTGAVDGKGARENAIEHYRGLIASGKSMEAGQYYEQNKALIRGEKS